MYQRNYPNLTASWVSSLSEATLASFVIEEDKLSHLCLAELMIREEWRSLRFSLPSRPISEIRDFYSAIDSCLRNLDEIFEAIQVN